MTLRAFLNEWHFAEPPTVAAEYDRLIRIPSGRNVALTCPVLPNRSLIITWYKVSNLSTSSVTM
jgi:hypothetical protein